MHKLLIFSNNVFIVRKWQAYVHSSFSAKWEE